MDNDSLFELICFSELQICNFTDYVHAQFCPGYKCSRVQLFYAVSLDQYSSSKIDFFVEK